MGMHTISVIYDPTTRRISLADSSNAYGGATTDDNSVNISVTGITADGENFAARVDFAVPIKVDNHNVIHPFVLLEQSGNEWTAVIPRAVLMATKDCRNKLPLQLVLANDSQVINSRNTIVLDVTQGIDADTEGSELPEYVVPEWEVPEGTVSEDEDVHVIEVTYDPETRMLTLDNENSKYGGATIDTKSVKVQISGIVPDGIDFSARVDFAVPIMVDERRILKPFTVLENVNGVWCAMVPQAVLMAAHDIKKLPFQLVTRHGDTVINSRNTIVVEITRAINAMQSTVENYTPYIMYRNDTWEWVEDFTYGLGSVVTKDGEIYVSLTDDNLGHDPEGPGGEQYWELKGNGIPNNGKAWQILGVDSEHVYDPIWRTLSEKHSITTSANTNTSIEHQFGNRPVICTFYDESGQIVDVPYVCGNGSIAIETTSAHTLTVVITAVPYEVVS